MGDLGPPRLFDPGEPSSGPNGALSTEATTTAVGALSEMAAIRLLVTRGYKVAVPVVDDDGVDLIVSYRHLVQVKSASRRNSHSTWVFNIGRARYNRLGERTYGMVSRSTSWQFLVCHASPVDAWWIIPRRALVEAGMRDQTQAISLSSDPLYRTKYASIAARYRDAWDLLAPEA